MADDWLGEISDYEWDEGAGEHERAAQFPGAADDVSRSSTSDAGTPQGPVGAAEAHRAVVERRRLVAGLVVAAVLGVGIVIALLLLRGGAEPAAETDTSTTTTSATTTPSTPQETPTQESPTQESPTQETPGTTTSTQPPPSTAQSFTLPEGTKLRLGEGDPELVRQLQQTLITAGYDPGSVDGSFGPTTEAAVTAFQQDNGLSPDGVVGPETASALNSAVSSG